MLAREKLKLKWSEKFLVNYCDALKRGVQRRTDGRRWIPSQLLSRRSTLNKALPDVQEADHREVRYDGGTLGQNCIKMFGSNMLLISKYLAQKDDEQVRIFFKHLAFLWVE